MYLRTFEFKTFTNTNRKELHLNTGILREWNITYSLLVLPLGGIVVEVLLVGISIFHEDVNLSR